MSKKATKLNSTNLQNTLWETLNDVRTGDLDYQTANAVAAQARGIVSIARTQIQVAKMLGRSPGSKVKGFIE